MHLLPLLLCLGTGGWGRWYNWYIMTTNQALAFEKKYGRRVNLDTIGRSIIVLFTPKKEEVYDYVNWKLESKIERNDNGIEHGLTFTTRGYVPIMWFPKKPKEKKDYGIVVHETMHAVHFILDGILTPLDNSTEEVYAYLSEYIFKEIIK